MTNIDGSHLAKGLKLRNLQGWRATEGLKTDSHVKQPAGSGLSSICDLRGVERVQN